MATVGHNAKRIGAEVLADMLAGYGVTHVFMVPAVLRRTFAEMERRTKIARIHCHGEKSAAYMADGYARASGKPGVCMAQVIHRGMKLDLPSKAAKKGSIPGVRTPIVIDGWRAASENPAPLLGQHTDEILKEIGEA